MFRHGEDFELVEDVATLDADALDTLLASSYGQQMFDGGETKGAIRGDYIAELASRSPKVYLATSGPNAEYAACAIVTERAQGNDGAELPERKRSIQTRKKDAVVIPAVDSVLDRSVDEPHLERKAAAVRHSRSCSPRLFCDLDAEHERLSHDLPRRPSRWRSQ